MDSEKIKILLIDDDESFLSNYKALLKRLGWNISVETAQSGLDGLKLAVDYSPDLILLDIIMPEMSGIEFLEKIKEKGIETRVVVVSGKQSYKDIIQCIRLGALDYISKPVVSLDLQTSIKRAMYLEPKSNLLEPPDKKNIKRENEDLRSRIIYLEGQISQFENRSKRTQLYLKLIYLFIFTIFAFCFKFLGFDTSQKEVIAFFTLVFLILIIPVNKIQEISGNFTKGEGKIKLE